MNLFTGLLIQSGEIVFFFKKKRKKEKNYRGDVREQREEMSIFF